MRLALRALGALLGRSESFVLAVVAAFSCRTGLALTIGAVLAVLAGFAFAVGIALAILTSLAVLSSFSILARFAFAISFVFAVWPALTIGFVPIGPVLAMRLALAVRAAFTVLAGPALSVGASFDGRLKIYFFGTYSTCCSFPWSKFAAVFRKTIHCFR